MNIVILVGVIVSFITLVAVVYNDKRSTMQRMIDNYIQNTVRYPGEEWDFLIKVGALNLSNRNMQRLCREIKKRGCKHPFGSFPGVLREKSFKKTLQAYFNKENKEKQS